MKIMMRLVLYLVGLFFLAIGINLSIVSTLGISPVSSFILPLSKTLDLSLGTVTIIIYTIFLLIQIILLKKKFKIKNLLQLPCSVMFGFFVDLASKISVFLDSNVYILKLILMLAGISSCAFGITIYIIMDIVPNPPEGLNMALSNRFDRPLSKIKVICDCTFIFNGIIISYLFLGGQLFIREGTIISALLTGRVIAIFMKYIKPTLLKFIFNRG